MSAGQMVIEIQEMCFINRHMVRTCVQFSLFKINSRYVTFTSVYLLFKIQGRYDRVGVVFAPLHVLFKM